MSQTLRTNFSGEKILEVFNVEKDRGYALKIDGEDNFKFVVSTSHFEEKYDRNISVGDELPRNVSIDVPLKFLSTLLVKGLEDLKINKYKYNYGSDEFNITVKIKKSEKKLDLQLGPKFNYKKEHELFLSLHSESKFRIILHFDVNENHCKFDQSSILYPARLLNDSKYGYEFNLKGINSLYYHYGNTGCGVFKRGVQN